MIKKLQGEDDENDEEDEVDDDGDNELLLVVLRRWNINWGDDVGKSWLKPAILYNSPGRWLPPLDVDGSGNGVSIG